MDCDKQPHANSNAAFKAMKYLNRHKGYGLKAAYVCRTCGKWHVTSHKDKRY